MVVVIDWAVTNVERRENFYMDYQMMEEIGSGAFGRAIKAKRRSDQETVVVKELIGRKMTAKDIQEVQHFSLPSIHRLRSMHVLSCVTGPERSESTGASTSP